MKTQVSRAISLAQSSAPAEFRLFKRGVNSTQKGEFMFDDEAARSVMAEYERHGIDLMIDLEHDSLSADAKAFRSDAADARGWFQLSVRSGELWAVNVRWAPDGIERLTSKKQRYISPTFHVDEQGRVLSVVNCALCAHPATYGAAALVAASRSGVIGVRMPRTTLASVRALAKSRGTTVSGLLLSGMVLLAKTTEGQAPAPDMYTALKALLDTLGLSLELTSKEEILDAISYLIEDEESHLGDEALSEGADAPPQELSVAQRAVAYVERARKRASPVLSNARLLSSILGCKPDEAEAVARSFRSAVSRSQQADAAVRTLVASVTGPAKLSASEIEACREVGASLEAYAANKAIREAAREGKRQ